MSRVLALQALHSVEHGRGVMRVHWSSAKQHSCKRLPICSQNNEWWHVGTDVCVFSRPGTWDQSVPSRRPVLLLCPSLQPPYLVASLSTAARPSGSRFHDDTPRRLSEHKESMKSSPQEIHTYLTIDNFTPYSTTFVDSCIFCSSKNLRIACILHQIKTSDYHRTKPTPRLYRTDSEKKLLLHYMPLTNTKRIS